jgi:hypothetical protein
MPSCLSLLALNTTPYPLLPDRCKDWFLRPREQAGREGARKDMALASTTFKVALKDHEALAGQED